MFHLTEMLALFQSNNTDSSWCNQGQICLNRIIAQKQTTWNHQQLIFCCKKKSPRGDNTHLASFFKMLAIANDFREYSFMVILPVGIVLNFLTIVTFVKVKMHKSSTGLHLTSLAISESLLLMAFAFYWGRSYRFNYTNSVHCIIENFAISSMQTWSSLLMVSTTVERYVAIAFPLKVKSWNLKLISEISVSCSVFLSLVYAGLSAARRTLIKGSVHNSCGIIPNFEEENMILNKVTTIFGYGFSLSYPVLTFIFTVLIAHQIYKQKKARNTLVQEGQISNSNKEFRISLMLFVVACMFLVSSFFYTLTWFIAK